MPILGKKLTDDFHGDWSKYTEHYMAELAGSPVSAGLIPGQYQVIGGKIHLGEGLPPLHVNHQAIYEAALHLDPGSVLEVGCGAGDHVFNLSQLLPKAKVQGCDLLETQLDVLDRRHPGLRPSVFQHDIVVAVPPVRPELVYTQAVLMHLGSGRLLAALWHIFAASTAYVLMMENWNCHDFYQNIDALASMRCFPWETLYCYVGTATEQDLLVCSRWPLVGPYEPLGSDKRLRRRLR